MDKKTILAILLSAIVWIAWFLWFQPKEKQESPQKPRQETVVEKAGEKPAVKTPPAAPAMISPARAAIKESTVETVTDHYRFEFTTKGAAINKASYIDKKIELVVAGNPYAARNLIDFSMHFSDDEFINGNMLDNVVWDYVREKDGIRFFTNISMNGQPLLVEKAFTFKKDTHSFRLSYRIKNPGKQSASLQAGTVIFSPGDMLGPSVNFNNRYNEIAGIYSLDDDFETARKGGGFFSKPESLKKEEGKISWSGLSSRYFLLIMIPQGFTGTGVITDNREQTGFRTGMYAKINEIKAGETVEKSFNVYLGERDKEKLGAVDPSIVDAADVSKWIEPIRVFVLWCLLGINKFIGNLGWSLVIFSIITKIAFMPLTIKSTESMKRMQMLTPKLNELKVKYKDKPEMLQKEMMKLYKENKVNPMGGCLPILLQMPFFFALYSALVNSLDLWQAPFIFWIKDLSMPDTVLSVSGFDLNILPLVMTGTTFLQQKLTTVDTGQQQKIMMMLMPFIFIFIFWNMPSGLVLYWSLQNIFQIAHQLIINKFGKKD